VLSKLDFKRRMLLLPVAATVGCLAVLGVEQALGARTHATLRRIEGSLVPSLEACRDLKDQLEEVQRAVQDAVAVGDAAALEATSALRDRFLARVRDVSSEPEGPEANEALASEFRAYYATARAAGEKLLAHRADEALIKETVARHDRVRAALAERTRDERAELAAGFEEARRAHVLMAFATAGCTLALVVVIGLLSRLVVRSVAAPVLFLARTAKRVADGDLTVHIEVRSSDELGELARSFQVMVEKLRTVPASLSESAGELEKVVHEVASASGAQASALENQVSALARSRSTAERILRESNETSRRADAVLKMAGQVEAFGDAAQLASRESLAGLSAIDEQVRAMTAGVAQVALHTQTIRDLVNTMKRLASESSELALQVSVEAARAGAGGGPLADSARLLKDVASRSTQASARITRALGEVDAALSGVGALSEDSKARMSRGLEQIRLASESLREITAVVQKSGRAARAIVSSVSEQGLAISEITHDVVKLDAAAAEAVRGSRRTQTHAESLKRTANRITGLVHSFRV
jgi:methyl-accepting chemotaxis protein